MLSDLEKELQALMASRQPMVAWSDIAKRYLDRKLPGKGEVPPPDRRLEVQELLSVLNGMVIRLARFQEYLDQRYGSGCGDQGHAAAVKEQNKTAAKVRKALGYSQAKHDITFAEEVVSNGSYG